MNIWHIAFILSTFVFFYSFRGLVRTAIASFENSKAGFPAFLKYFGSNKVIIPFALIILAISIAWFVYVKPLDVFVQTFTLGLVMMSVIYVAVEKHFSKLQLSGNRRR